MSMTPSGIARTVGLWILIIATSLSALIDFNHDNSVWGFFKIAVALAVLGFEGGYYLLNKMTISTKYKEFIKKHFWWGYTSLALFGLGLFGLILHLSVW